VATASETRGQEVETESQLAFDLDREGLLWKRELYCGQGEMHRRCIYCLRKGYRNWGSLGKPYRAITGTVDTRMCM
jgi:hypothetical protein